jgi:ferric-dicitrate binding protein FerR (iron transport regulator)
VWIQGEAFFKISQMDTVSLDAQLKKYKPFIVHTDRMDIEVLGTQFNVHARERKTSVTLNSGKVALRVHKPEGEENITMVPGEKITYDPEEKHLTKSWVAPEDETAWRYNKLVFDKTPLHEVAAVIEDYYGIQVVFENQQMHEREYVGSVTLDNVDALIKAISKLYNLEIERKGSVIIFKDKPAR